MSSFNAQNVILKDAETFLCWFVFIFIFRLFFFLFLLLVIDVYHLATIFNLFFIYWFGGLFRGNFAKDKEDRWFVRYLVSPCPFPQPPWILWCPLSANLLGVIVTLQIFNFQCIELCNTRCGHKYKHCHSWFLEVEVSLPCKSFVFLKPFRGRLLHLCIWVNVFYLDMLLL